MEQTLGKRIVQHRKRLGLTQDQLAEKLGVTAQAVSKWENDQSCPDITMLPKLAEIFGTTTDALLGSAPSQPVYQGEVVEPEPESHGDNHFEFTWNSGRKNALGFALLVLAVGIQLIIGKILTRDISFWNALWPSALLIFGIAGLFSKFSFVSMGCALFGTYFILDRWQLLPFTLGGELVFPIILVVFGLSLLVDAFKKPRKPHVSVKHNGEVIKKRREDYRINGQSFELDAAFAEGEKFISMPMLQHGQISTSFAEYTVDLSGVEAVAAECSLDINCSFGEVTVLIPSRFEAKLSTSSAFGEIEIEGQPDQHPAGTIHIDASASFGELTLRYI